MRKQTQHSSAQNQFKGSSHISVPKNPRYIYTEEDLGEGILDVGVSSYYTIGKQDNIHTKPWSTMLKTKFS